MSTQLDIIKKIKPHKENGTYKASVPATEILSFFYNSSLPTDTDKFEDILENLQTETKNLFSLVPPPTPQMPTTNAFSTCNGRWAEFLFASVAWNKLAAINAKNMEQHIDTCYLYVKLPDYKNSNTKWTTLLESTYQEVINKFDRDNTDPEVKASGHSRLTLYASNPDSIILKYNISELEQLKLPLSPFIPVSNLDIYVLECFDNIFSKVAKTVTPSKNIIAFLSMKNSLRPDRKYQFVREGDNIKAHLMRLFLTSSDAGLTRDSFKSKYYYAISFKEIPPKDNAITDIASSVCLASPLLPPFWSVDKLDSCLTISDAERIIQQIINEH